MELNISETEEFNYNTYDQIPENIPIKITKKDNRVRFNSDVLETNTNINVPTKSAVKKVVRPHVPEPKPKISYDDILSKMGMFVADGQLHLLDNQPPKVQQQIKQKIQQKKQEPIQEQYQEISTPQNSYIYNKYFNNEVQNNIGPRVPKNLQEYKNMLVQDIIQKQRIKQIKSTKLIMPNSNIHFAPYSSHNMNKLFSFSNR
jgi:hypothetical protein